MHGPMHGLRLQPHGVSLYESHPRDGDADHADLILRLADTQAKTAPVTLTGIDRVTLSFRFAAILPPRRACPQVNTRLEAPAIRRAAKRHAADQAWAFRPSD